MSSNQGEVMTENSPLLKSIKAEERRITGDPVVAQKARMLAARRHGSKSEAWAAMTHARELGATWEELAWALDMCAPDTEEGYQRAVLSTLSGQS